MSTELNEDELARAERLIADAKKKSEDDCMVAVNAELEKFNCELVPVTRILGQRLPTALVLRPDVEVIIQAKSAGPFRTFTDCR